MFPMIRLNAINKSYGPSVLFQSLRWHIRPQEKIGLIGDNGSGKTTLLKILAGHLEPDRGERLARRDLRIGHLGQEIAGTDGEVCLLDEVLQGRNDLLEMERNMEDLSQMISKTHPDQSEKLVERLATEQEKFQRGGGYAVVSNAKSTLFGLGFREEDLSRRLNSFSGGWRMRGHLAKILLSSPNLLLLDEPTNHLDIESTVWLERFLKTYQGSLVLISHDRYLLNRLVTSIADLDNGSLTLYPYSFDRYVKEKQLRVEALEKQAKQQQKEMAHQQKFIDRFRAKNTKATQVQSRMKALEKLEKVEIYKPTSSIHFSFQEAGRINLHAVECVDAVQGYGDNIVYNGLNFTLNRGDRVALVGPNGHGKSTLLKLIAGRVPIKSGSISLGSNVVVLYFAQHQIETLNMNNTILEEVTQSIPNESIPKARTVLGAFLFQNDEVKKKIQVLSGGEKSRVALAKIALTPTNLLLLDEPTNHLDLKSRQVLERVLSKYTGCIMMISHDRAFIDTVANKVIHVQNGSLTVYPGNYAYYEQKRDSQNFKTDHSVPESKSDSSEDAKTSKKDLRREAAKRRAELQSAVGPLKERLDTVEEEITKNETRIAEYDRLLADPETYKDREKSKQLSKDIAQTRIETQNLIREWEDLSEKIEELTLEFNS